MGKMYSNVTGLSIGAGIVLGIYTFVSQNHGRGADEENGLVLRQCCQLMVPMLLFSFSVSLLSIPLLRILDQPHDLLKPVQQFATIQALGLPPAFFSEALVSTLNSQCVVVPGMIADTAACIFNTAMASGYLGSAVDIAALQWLVCFPCPS